MLSSQAVCSDGEWGCLANTLPLRQMAIANSCHRLREIWELGGGGDPLEQTP